MNSLQDLPTLREVVSSQGLSARKSLGQNFLFDLNVTSKIARSAGSLHDHDILEIGPGPGGLTRSLLAEGARRVIVLEKDRRFHQALSEIAQAVPGRLTVVQGDAMEFDPDDLLVPPVRVVANLPYNIASRLLVRWVLSANWPPFWSTLTLMFQREVAERIVAPPGLKSYGRLSVFSQWRTEPRILFTLSSRAFIPQPKVDSAVVHFERRSSPQYPADTNALVRVVSSAFSQRRKMLRSSLRGLCPDIENRLHAAGLNPAARADQVSIGEYCALARELSIQPQSGQQAP